MFLDIFIGSGEFYAAGPATRNQTLAVTGNATVGGNLTTAGARSVVSSNITNTQSDGFSSMYLNTPFGIGQMYSGQNEGLVLATNTAHPIRLNANRFAAGALNSIEIKGTGTRDVEINAPLLVKGTSTVHSGNVTVNGSLVVGGTNVMTAISNLGASQLSPSSVYTKAEIDDWLSYKAPLANPAFSGNVTVSGYCFATCDLITSASVSANRMIANGNNQVLVDDNLSVSGNLAVTGTMTNGSATVLTDSTGYTQTAADNKFATLTGTQVLTNKTVTDTSFAIQDDADNTKKAKFEASSISTATTRTYTLPNVSGTLITTGDAGSVSNAMLAIISETEKVSNSAATQCQHSQCHCGMGCKW